MQTNCGYPIVFLIAIPGHVTSLYRHLLQDGETDDSSTARTNIVQQINYLLTEKCAEENSISANCHSSEFVVIHLLKTQRESFLKIKKYCIRSHSQSLMCLSFQNSM